MKVFFVLALISVLMIGCAHKQKAQQPQVESNVSVAEERIGENYSERQAASNSDGDKIEEAAADLDKSEDLTEELDEDLDDDLDEDWDDLGDVDQQEILEIADPLYYFNKAMFHFNDKFYLWLLKPAATGYNFVLPEFVRTSIQNFFYNISFPVRFAGSVLQGKGNKAQAEFSRFFFNSTFGVLGFGNPAKNYPHLVVDREDLGQAFAHWGIGDGFYLVLPFFGPSTFRDTVGFAGDFLFYPISYINPWYDRFALHSLRVVNLTSFKLGDYKAFKEAAFDPYASMRDGYLQDRKIHILE